MKQTLQLDVPEFVSIDKYREINSYKGEDTLGRLVHTVSKITGKPKEEVSSWSIDSMKRVSNVFADLADNNEEFHSLIEWNGTLYGYAHIKQASLGEYVDLENLCNDLENNMHKVAAIFYRPVIKHKFDSIKFTVKHSIKMASNEVENVFDWYDIETYDSKKRKEREEEFKGFPVHIFLGALSFFLSTASQYLNSIASSEKKISKTKMEKMNNIILGSLLVNTGGGGGLSTTSRSPIYYQYQETKQSPTLTL